MIAGATSVMAADREASPEAANTELGWQVAHDYDGAFASARAPAPHPHGAFASASVPAPPTAVESPSQMGSPKFHSRDELMIWFQAH